MVHHSSSFTWHLPTKTLVSEASTLGRGSFMDSNLRFKIISGHTGEEVSFFLADVFRDEDGDISYWKFLPVLEDSKKLRPGTSVKVFNT